MADREEDIKHYHIGYVRGAFDMFHIGHLNLLKRCKAHCDFLIVGVNSDDFILEEKNKVPVIPQEERVEIIRSIRYVDEAIIMDYHNSPTEIALGLFQFDVQFCGDDHEQEYQGTKVFLQSIGSDMVFFPYTMSTSSTKIKAKIKESKEK